jgi:uncharacterized protein (TIGR04255 family)
MSPAIKFSGEIKINPEKSKLETDSKSLEKGKFFHSADNHKLIQMREDGFTFNMQAPYTNWDDFYKTCSYYFNLYLKYFPVKSIDRVALRYINQFLIPLPIKKFDDIFTCPPKIPKNLPTNFSNYFCQIQVPFLEEGIILNLTQSTLESKEESLPLLLDIDVFKFGKFSAKELDSIFNRLREIKNTAFQSSLTQQTLDLFK